MRKRIQTARRLGIHRFVSWGTSLVAGLAMLSVLTIAGLAQTGGDGAISGTVTDQTGALVPNAIVIAANNGTGVLTKRTSSSDGLYNISPLLPGSYTVTVTAVGFSTFKQENITVLALNNFGLNVTLKTGAQNETVTVTSAPPQLETTNATLGGTIENNLITKLPIMIAGLQQRDITQFSNLLPGAQVPPGGRSSIVGGTGQRLGELYVDGLPITTQSQQGDNRPVFNIIPLEAIDQVKVVTSGFSAEYQGAGLENYNLKSGTNTYHGAVFGYFRNTVFDAWSFSSKPGGGNTKQVVQNGQLVTVPGDKPAENQNEVGFSVGGPVKIPFLFNGRDKLFFYAAYDKFHSRQAANPSATTVPTALMRQGDFRELLSASATTGGLGNSANVNYPIYDPTTLASCSAHSTNGPCRYQYGYGPGASAGANGNPVLVSPGKANVIPASQISAISQYQQSFLPDATITTPGTIQNNYLGGVPQGFDNWLYSGRADYNISQRQTLSFAITGGNRHAVPYTSSSAAPLPVPYYASTISTVGGHWADLQHTFTLTPHLVNQFKFGFMNFGGPPVQNIVGSMANSKYALKASGITGLPAGQASDNAANTTFSGSNPPSGPTTSATAFGWVGNTPTTTNVSNTYTLLDNLNWLKGKHSMNFGGQYQWLENNASTADGPSTPTNITWSPNETASIGGTTYTANTGYSYASFLLGAVNASTGTLQPFSLVGGRFHPFAVYFQDDYKVLPKLTLNLGLRWDYSPTYREDQDRWSFLNPNIANPITGNPGALQFAGNRGGTVGCNCRTPVDNYYKNFGPRLGFAFSPDDKTVFRGGWGVLFSHAGGTGGAGGAGTGTGQAGFNTALSFTDNAAGSSAGPAFYLNNSSYFQSIGLGNTNYGGPGYTLPAITPIGPVSQTMGTGYYVCSGQAYAPCNGTTGGSAGNGTGIAYPDPYLGGRAPQFIFWNFGIQKEVANGITVTANYVGSQSHFIAGAGNMRGLQSGQMDPKWFALGSFLTMRATQLNINAAQAATGLTLPIPYTRYIDAAGVNSNATIAHMLTWMPQYSGSTDTWGNIANANYNAFQLSVGAREWHGLTMNVNYTYSKNIDDAGTARSGWAIPASATLAGHAWAQNRIDRSLSANSQPQNLSIYGVYSLPFGKGKIGGEHFLVRALAGGWDFSNIFQYSAGLPLAIGSTCVSPQSIGQGTCMPDVNPNFLGSVRVNGGWGKGVTAKTLGTMKYMTANPGDAVNTSLSGTAGTGSGKVACLSSTGPFCDSGNYMIGDAPRVAPYGLRGMGVYRWTSALRRTFDITERAKFIFGVDCQNVTNTVTFGNNAANNQIQVNVDNASFGTLNFASGDPRAFQFSGRFTF